MLGPGSFDLLLYRGDSYLWRVRLWEDKPGGIPTDITGATVAAQIREKFWGVKIVDLGCVLTPPNTIDLRMTPEMWHICPIAGVWDLQVTMGDGEVRTVLAGEFISDGDVTESMTPPPANTGRLV